ncbi:recombination mediator RecR [uncultured Traorella sp.]|uniref:recombination mediator RecR n=1 Tax=uncultured Traorella sp. TaxID=1929048 RepID=UPI0025D7A425|nr:recombination mediator RecR [uncultured Traorella sp.]
MYPALFETLVESFRKLPGVGQKTAERYAFEFLKWDQEEIDEFLKACSLAKKNLHTCKICGNLAEDELCEVCKDTTRDTSTICVVEQVQDLIAMEKTHEYKGVYHVLNGVISPSKGILPDDINIDSLIKRCDDTISEVIIATNPTVEGETTALYLSKLLEKKNIQATRIAHGLPMGAHLDYADEMTLIKAMENRKKME